MNKKTIAINKPNQTAKTTNRFDQAATFATNTTAPHEVPSHEKVLPETIAPKAKPLQKNNRVYKEKYTEVFDAPLKLKYKIKIFIASPMCPFKDKSEFITTCINDGIIKYKNINQNVIVSINDDETYREIFNIPKQTIKDLRLFLTEPEKNGFKYKKGFIIQCIIDGLKKYGRN